MTFESSMDRLTKIAAELESGETALDESLKLYKEGAELIRELSARLDEAEKSIAEVKENENG